MKANSQWKCPECGHRFVTKNMSHSCGRYRLQNHFRSKPKGLLDCFKLWVATARRFGPVTVYAQKTRIVLQARVRFSAVTVRKNSLDTHLWLKRKVHHPLSSRTDDLGTMGYICHFRLSQPDDIDQGLIDLIAEAYGTNAQP
jgi:hypothetical protein